MKFLKVAFFILFILINISCGHTTQRPNNHDDDSNPLLDMASAFLQETLSQQGGNGGVSGIVGVASLIGNLMQNTADINGNDNNGNGVGGSKSNSGASQILSKISSYLINSNRGSNNGFDSSMFGNVLEMFENVDSISQNDEQNRQKRNLNDNNINDNNINKNTNNINNNNNNNNNNQNDDSGFGLDSILQIASTLIASQQQSQDKNRSNQDNGGFMMSILPMVMQAINTFSGPEGQRTQEKHKEHAWVLPPLLEQMHVLWDHFSNSELAEALWQKSGVNSIFKGFTGRDGKLDYDRLFESLHNQSFRRRWIKAATLYLADWANYFADPEVYQRYLKAGVLIFNGFLKSQGFPSATYFDPIRPSETISNLLDHIALKHLNVKVDSRQYVLPAVSYAKELLKLGQARGLIQKFNATELSDKLTDTLNLEVIEPVLKVHRAYRFAIETPHCDKYILCQLNSHDPNEKLGLAGFKPGITKFGSMAAAWFISLRSGTPFWTLISTVNEPYNCEIRFPVDCTAFHEGEAKVTTEYFHNEL